MLIARGLFLFVVVCLCSFPLPGADWYPIDPADLASKQSKTDPNADAEALFREVKVLNEQHGASYAKNIVSEYVRLKIFNVRGKESGNVLIPYFRDSNVYGVQGEIGQIVQYTEASVFTRAFIRWTGITPTAWWAGAEVGEACER